MCLDGQSEVETILSEDIDTIESLALDYLNGIIYWLDEGHEHIDVARFNGSHRRHLINATVKGVTVLDMPRALALHPKLG